jgi:PHP family Zn ribbon phosphoesterase
VPLAEIIAETWGRGQATKGVQQEYRRITGELGSEIQALIWTKADDLIAVAGEKLAQAVLKARVGDIQVDPGYDGVYGKIRIWPES